MSNDTVMEKRSGAEVAQKERTRSTVCYRPNVDIMENDDELTVVADMPGASQENIDVHFEDGTLTIYGKANERHPESASFLLREYGVGDFYRTFQVSEAIDVDKISAEYRDGVLTLHLPKTEAVRPRKIAVKVK